MDAIERLRLGTLPDRVGYALRRAQMAVFADFHGEFAEIGLRTAQFSVLVVLRENPGARASQVADALGIQRANFAPLIAGLETAGLVVRRTEPRDRRAAALHLSAAGEALLDQANVAADTHEARWRDRLGEADYRRLLGLLHRVAE